MLATGDVFAGYAIERQLGQGGMGSVYLARHPRLPRQTALKILNQELFTDTEMRARFEREADLAAQLEHPNIVTVYDRGVDANRLWISMQFVDGVDAATIERPVPVERALHIIEGTAAALDHAHGAGVLHRDVKPANILLTGDRVLLTDFGIARPREDTSNLTRTGTFTATLAYAAPEQLTGSPLDHRADQYSLACTLFALVTGVAPFEAGNPVLVIQGHLQSPPPSVRAQRPELPVALDAVLARALAKRPAERFDSCAEFAAAVRRAVTGAGAQATMYAASSAPQLPHANPYPTHISPPPPGNPAGHASSPGQVSPLRHVSSPGHVPPSRQAQPPGYGSSSGRVSPTGHAPRGSHSSHPGHASATPHPAPSFAAPQHGYPSGQAAAPRPAPGQWPRPQRAVAPRRRRRGALVALAIVVALVAGAGVWLWRDDSSFFAVTWGRSKGHADLNAMAAEFPGLLPDSHKETDGAFGTTCRAAPRWQAFYQRKGPEAAVDGWQARWECLSPADGGFAFRFYSYDSEASLEHVLTSFAASAEHRGTSSDGPRQDQRFVFVDEYGGVKSTVISRFTDGGERSRFLLFAIPRFMGEETLDELSQQVAAAPW